MRGYRARLVARNEGLRYEDPDGVYRFDVSLEGKTWVVSLPPSRGREFEPHVLTDEERARILPRVRSFLSRI